VTIPDLTRLGPADYVPPAPPCPRCKSENTKITGWLQLTPDGPKYDYVDCRDCRHGWDTRPRVN
jgi:hypothetical protein